MNDDAQPTEQTFRSILEKWSLPTNVLKMSIPEKHKSICKRLKRFPTALEFMKDYVSKSIPFVVEGGVSSYPACSKWNFDYLNNSLSNEMIKLYISMDGDFEVRCVIVQDVTLVQLFHNIEFYIVV